MILLRKYWKFPLQWQMFFELFVLWLLAFFLGAGVLEKQFVLQEEWKKNAVLSLIFKPDVSWEQVEDLKVLLEGDAAFRHIELLSSEDVMTAFIQNQKPEVESLKSLEAQHFPTLLDLQMELEQLEEVDSLLSRLRSLPNIQQVVVQKKSLQEGLDEIEHWKLLFKIGGMIFLVVLSWKIGASLIGKFQRWSGEIKLLHESGVWGRTIKLSLWFDEMMRFQLSGILAGVCTLLMMKGVGWNSLLKNLPVSEIVQSWFLISFAVSLELFFLLHRLGKRFDLR